MIDDHSEYEHLGEKPATEVLTSQKSLNLKLYNVPFR